MKKGLIIIITIIVLILVVIIALFKFGVLGNKGEILEVSEPYYPLSESSVFNQTVLPYVGNNRNISSVKALYSSVQSRNLQSERQIDILLNGKMFDINDLKEDAKYRVTVEYDEGGYINKVIVEEVAEEIKETYDKIDDKILEDYLFTIRNVALNTPCNKIYVYKDGTYIIEKAFWTDLESNILSKGDISNLGNMNDLLSKLEKDSKEHQDSEHGYELTKRGNIKMYVNINSETLQSILDATEYGGGVLH